MVFKSLRGKDMENAFTDKIIKELGELKFNYIRLLTLYEEAQRRIAELEKAPVQDSE